ncbi:MAG: hypothetical protein WAO27_09085 [Limnochordia bacterium]
MSRSLDNEAEIDQVGDLHEASILQSGIANYSLVLQRVEGNWTAVEQRGFMNSAFAYQYDSYVEISIYQDGDGNTATVTQGDHVDSDGFMEAWVVQDGDGNLAEVIQLRGDAHASVEQFGNYNEAYQTQDNFTGEGLAWAVIEQDGRGNYALQTQTSGSGLEGYIYQTGRDNVATQTQSNAWSLSPVPSYALTTQTGNENEGHIVQTSQSAMAIITQTGNNNLATINQ